MDFFKFLRILFFIFLLFAGVSISYVLYLSNKYELETTVYTEPNWEDAPDGYDWFAVDKDGRGYFYTNQPILNEPAGVWASRGFAVPSKGKFNVDDWRGAVFSRNKRSGNVTL